MKTLHLLTLAILFVIVFTSSNITLAQVAPVAAFQLASFKGNHGIYQISYNIVNGTVVGTPLDLPAKALMFEINTTSNGQLTVELPRAIIDSKNGSEDVPYFVSIYDIRSLGGPVKITPEEISSNDIRILKINFPKNVTEIQIVGTFFVEKYHYVPPNSISLLSPLKQYETGLEVKDVTCKSDFQLMIKSEDGFPACVRPQTVQKLVERSWGTSWGISITKNTSENSTRSNPVIDIISISGTGSPPNPGGPEIQMTLKNTGMKPVTNLIATLVLNNNYTFNFKYVTESNPLAPDQLTTETQILIGGGYSTGIPYPLIVTGTVNNEPFSYTLNVPIPYSNKIIKYQKENSTYALKLFMSTDSDIIQPEKPIGITISVNNTLETPVDISAQKNWSYPNVSTGPCYTIGYGVSILDGFYNKNNLTRGKVLNLFNPDTNCPIIQETANVYEFQPNSGNVKQIQCKPIEGLQCYAEPYQMGQSYKFNGYWDGGTVQPFKSGIYTVVGADEWGHVAIEHFVVTNSTIFAGDLGPISCPMMIGGVQFSATIKNSTGFANYYNSTKYGHTFFLHPGMQGTINVLYTSTANASWLQKNGNAPFNVTNGATLLYMANVTNSKMIISYAVSLYNDGIGHHSKICHYGTQYGGFTEPCNSDNSGDIPPSELSDASRLLHPGISTSIEPNSVMLYPNSNSVFTAAISTNSDAMPGTYWLSLERSLCGPGVLAKLVVLP